MLRKFVFLVVTSVLVFTVTIFFRLGGYKSVDVALKAMPAMYLVYKEHLGPYNEIESTIEEVEVWAHTHNLDCSRTFGEFFDDPRTGDERRLRSNAGCVSMTKPSDAGPYKIEERPAQNYVWTSFDGAPSIGPLKIYPKIHDFIDEHHLKSTAVPLEVYTIKSGSVITEYYFAVDSGK
jgi:AraC family transcriptional regulator